MSERASTGAADERGSARERRQESRRFARIFFPRNLIFSIVLTLASAAAISLIVGVFTSPTLALWVFVIALAALVLLNPATWARVRRRV